MIIFFFPGTWLCVLKWKKLISVYKIDLPFKDLYQYYLIGTFFNNFLPSTIGGDISRVVHLKNVANKPAEITASILMERLTGLIALVFLCLFALTLNPSIVRNFKISYNVLLISSIFLFFISLVLIFVFLRADRISCCFTEYRTLIVFREKIAEVLNAICYYRKYKRTLIIAFLISILFVLSSALCSYLYFLSIDVKVPVLELIQIYTLVRLIGSLPISINSLGITEGLYIILFSTIGVNSVDALTVALLGRILLLLVSLSGGFLFILKDKNKLDLSKAMKD